MKKKQAMLAGVLSVLVLGSTQLPYETSAEKNSNAGSFSAESPFVLPKEYEQVWIMNEKTDGDFLDFPGMNVLNETGDQAGRYLYRTHQLNHNAAVSVTDLSGREETKIIFQREDLEELDELVWTPWGTVLTAENISNAAHPDPNVPNAVHGLIYEINPADGSAKALPALGSLSHKGIQLDANGNVYLTDYDRKGTIYRFVPEQPGDLTSGQLYALRTVKKQKDKDITAEWVALDKEQVLKDARSAAAKLKAADYKFPGDMAIKENTLYVAITGEDRVLSISLDEMPIVHNFIQAGDITSKKDFHNPSYLTLDNEGNLWIAEDNEFADVWLAKFDDNNDGTADSVERFASLSDKNAVPTGLYFDPVGSFAPSDSQKLFLNIKNAKDGNDKTFVIRKKPNADLQPEPTRWMNAEMPDQGAADPIVSAHRGAPWLAPENTLDSYRYAFAYGADLVEVDVRETKDGKLVSFHDSTVDSKTDGTGRISDMTYDEVRALNAADNDQWLGSEYDPAQVASIEEILELAEQVGGGIEFDIKEISDPGKLANLAAQYDGVIERSIFNSSDIRIKQAQPEAKLIYNRNRYETPGMLYLLGSYYSVYGSRLDEYTPESIIAIHDAGGIVIPHSYDFGPELEGQTFLNGRAIGIDGAQTNQTDVILDVLDTPVVTSISVEGGTLTARLTNASNGMGIPLKPLIVEKGSERIELTTSVGGAIHLPEGWNDARISFAGDATAQPSTFDGSTL
ncbi:glycerophosphodiester phosphodiesterase family protein [Paenibacillus spongiae]|uniref:DUF839 domain-containing protein n=1 Tax=Paenibacillus spongiae TaxID=2909671 RepID=A0ABY5SKA0_9BACL|nr:glycerophosphodiester phosphodiesterase family protein [Paenibacillus spongiae]UVI32940.1 DUF839 domain-containing protein [Paenibacillus spongiae]